MIAMTTTTWVTLVAGIGIGTIVASLVSAWTNKAVAISAHRQAWINALRDHLSDYLHAIDKLEAARARHDTRGPIAVAEERRSARKEYRQILLRLNADEAQHQVLAESLAGLLDDGGDARIAQTVVTSRAVLKREWEVTKGLTFKRVWRWLQRRAGRKP